MTAGLIQKLVDENATRYAALESRMDSMEKERERKEIQYDLFSGFLAGLGETEELLVDFNEKLFHRLVDYTTVYPDGRGGVHLPQRRGGWHRDLKENSGQVPGIFGYPAHCFCVFCFYMLHIYLIIIL